MNTFLKLTALVVLFSVIQLSHQQATDGKAKRAANVDKIMRAFSQHSSSTALRNKREVADGLKDLLQGILDECYVDNLELATELPLPEGPCSSMDTVNLTDAWRQDNQGSDIQPGGSYNCDAYLFDNIQWFRITGDAGNKIRDTCSPSYSCGSHGGIWTDAEMPTDVGEIRQVALYGSWSGDCTWYPWLVDYPLTVQRCTVAGDFVYKIDGQSGCHHSICGMN